MTKTIISIPKGAIRCSVYEAMRAMREEKKDICVMMFDVEGDAYAGQIYLHEVVTSSESNYMVVLSEMAEYIHSGVWYVIDRYGKEKQNV